MLPKYKINYADNFCTSWKKIDQEKPLLDLIGQPLNLLKICIRQKAFQIMPKILPILCWHGMLSSPYYMLKIMPA